MKYLVGPVLGTSVSECERMLRDAHDLLAAQGAAALSQACEAPPGSTWGSQVKRVTVCLAADNRPALVPADVTDHNLTEVINQCANLERLIEALAWVRDSGSGLAAYSTVESCHPTTSSAPRGSGGGNDLILVSDTGARARFEVCDVVSEKDSNRKEERSLVRLGILTEEKGSAKLWIGSWPQDRVFLVVSEELANRLRKSKPLWISSGHCRYVETKGEGPTRVFEVCKGKRWGEPK